jgi:hypothetical protein
VDADRGRNPEPVTKDLQSGRIRCSFNANPLIDCVVGRPEKEDLVTLSGELHRIVVLREMNVVPWLR